MSTSKRKGRAQPKEPRKRGRLSHDCHEDYNDMDATHSDDDRTLSKAFHKVLTTIANLDIFGLRHCPTIFVVYAHDNPIVGNAYAHCVRELIKWLGDARATILSDQSPLALFSTREDGDAAARNILSNQFCLLPNDSTVADDDVIRSVDKVVLCGSAVLRNYYESSPSLAYIQQIEDLYWETQAHSASFKAKIPQVVHKHSGEYFFHHVLTELAFLHVRHAGSNNMHGVIPVSLDGDLMQYIPFLRSSDVILRLKSDTGLHHLHGLFFNLLQHLYPNQQDIINEFRQCYYEIVNQLQDGFRDEMTFFEAVDAIIQRTVAACTSLGCFAIREMQRREESMKKDQIYALSEKQLKCLQAFKPAKSYEQQKNNNPDRAENTCRWVLESSQFRNWHENAKSNLLLITADPGCGKSVLARSLIDKEFCQTGHTVCYFFFKDNEQQDSLQIALSAILHQLFSQRPMLIGHAIDAWQKDKNLTSEVDQMWRILQLAAADSESKGVICVFDALDECHQIGRKRLINFLSTFYGQRCSTSPREEVPLKFLVTSRPYDYIRYTFGEIPKDLPNIRLYGEKENESIHEEIDSVVRAEVKKISSDLDLSDTVTEKLETKLLNMKHRTYLWLYLAIEDVRKAFGNSDQPSEAAIDMLPSSVTDAYEKILSRVDDKLRGKVKSILQIIVGARRPLTIGEIALAYGVARSEHSTTIADVKLDPAWFEKQIPVWCGLFVFINYGKVYLIHQTAKEFLLCEGESASSTEWKQCLNSSKVEETMTRICVNFLLIKDAVAVAKSIVSRMYDIPFKGFDEENQVEGVLAYSAENWSSHLRAMQPDAVDLLKPKILRLCDTEADFLSSWFPIFYFMVVDNDGYDRLPTRVNKICLAALLGHEKVLQWALESDNNLNVDEPDDNKQSALSYASKFGYFKIVQLLLNSGANVNFEPGAGFPPLFCAAAEGHVGVVMELLKNHADIEFESLEFGTALQTAAFEGHSTTVQLLLDSGANVNEDGEESPGPALTQAASRGHLDIVRMLLEAGADINNLPVNGEPALSAASRNGHLDVVRLLLERGADPNINHNDYGIPLIAAASKGENAIVKLLLDSGADAGAYGSEVHGTALSCAAGTGQLDTVHLLLAQGIDPNAHDDKSMTPLQAATESGHIGIMQLLLERGADINALGGNREKGTALAVAAAKNNCEMMMVLLNLGADINALGKCFGNALCTASALGCLEAVKLLLEQGADVNAEDAEYGNPLCAASKSGRLPVLTELLKKKTIVDEGDASWAKSLAVAASEGHLHVVELLLDKGVNSNAQLRSGCNALQAACARGHQAIAELLLANGADPNLKGEQGNSLYLASENGYRSMVKLLLKSGANLNDPGGEYGSSLCAALFNRHFRLAKLLLDQGSDINLQIGEHGSALYAAAFTGTEPMVRLLLEKGANPNIKCGKLGNALCAAAFRCHRSVVEFLLDRGANVNNQGGYYGNALQAASSGGHIMDDDDLDNPDTIAEASEGDFDVDQFRPSGLMNVGQFMDNCEEQDYVKMVEKLLEHGADISSQGGKYGTALQAAAAFGQGKIVELLLKWANVNA